VPSRSWPSSPLAAAERAFTLLVQPPTDIGFDGCGVDGLPDEVVPLDRLRSLLLSRQTAADVRDAVWRELVIRARRDGPAWVVAAVGMAMPGLRRGAGLVAAGWRGDTHDLDAELLVGFVARLATIDLEPGRVCGRLIDAGLRAARKSRDAESDAQLIRVGANGPIAPIHPWDHPDLVLARAVAAGVIDADEANLIAATRLDNTTLARAAARIGIPSRRASSWRVNAERRLLAAILDGELTFVPLRPRRRPGATTRAWVAAAREQVAAVGERHADSGATQQRPGVGLLLGRSLATDVASATQQQALVGKTPDRSAAGAGAPGIGTRPA